MASDSFIKIRRGLMQHLMDGKMTGKELSVYVSIHLFADYDTGIAMKISSPFLARFLDEQSHSIKRRLKSLEKNDYIKRFNHRGQRTYYPVLINKYQLSNGLILRADKSISLNEICLQVPFNCTLSVLQKSFKCTLNVLQVFPIQEVKEIIINKRNKRIEEQVLPDEDIYRKFKHLRITNKEVEKLVSNGYTKEQIDRTIDSVENYRQNTKYVSLYKTVENWIKGDNKPKEKKYGIIKTR